MDYVHLKPRAKINISLDVLRRLETGYHELEMIMQTVSLHDDLFIKKTEAPGIRMEVSDKSIPSDERNLVYRACKLVMDEFDLPGGLYIDLYKRIPANAGLGGGSSDAASALAGMRKLFRLDMADGDLLRMGLSLGADIPFFINGGGTALACGIGDKLTPLPRHPYVHVLAVKPSVDVSTASVYGELKIESIKKRPDTHKIIRALFDADIRTVSSNVCNVLETVTLSRYPVIGQIKTDMLNRGALCSLMSGSGSAVFGYFADIRRALRARRMFQNETGAGGVDGRKVFLTGIY